MLYPNMYREVDVSVLLKRLPLNLIVNAGIPLNIHWGAPISDELRHDLLDILERIRVQGDPTHGRWSVALEQPCDSMSMHLFKRRLQSFSRMGKWSV